MFAQLLSAILHIRPDRMHQGGDYQLEKIYSYLNDMTNQSNVDFGIEMAEMFSKEFAKEWVTIIPGEMSFDEIKLLTTVACYFEREAQKNRQK
ncbi:hypothetical protein LJC55_02150 [Eubacteriales bacterium OttesenSCG-928-N14]|nr:hypothetical protein [Eubacteriales bacterium OttesenSCG-928-N14]